MARLNYISTAEYVPMSIQDLLVPLTLYKEAYEKSEAEYKDLTTKSNAFAYLSQSAPEGSKARAIYEKYANDLRVQAEDIARNGLSMSNRSALTSLGQRYSSEIGMLDMAQKAMEEHKKTWMAQRANDPSMLFATNTFNLDDYLFGATPNMYAVSGNELYKKGVALGASASARMFRSGDMGSTLAGMYRDYVQIYGYSPETMAKFRRDMSAIPELQQGVMDILRANGVTKNLKGDDLMMAAQQVMNGAIDGAVYKEQHDLHRDLNFLSPAEKQSMAIAAAQENRARAKFNMEVQDWRDQRNLLYEFDNNGNIIGYKSSNSLEDAGYVQDPRTGKWIRDWSKSGSKGGKGSSKSGSDSSGGSTEHLTQGKEAIRYYWNGNDPDEKGKEYAPEVYVYPNEEDTQYPGEEKTFEELPPSAQKAAMKRIGRGDASYYRYYYQKFKKGWANDTEAELIMVPVGIVVDDKTSFNLEGDKDLE